MADKTEITPDERPRHSPRRDIEKVEREYSDDKYARCLAFSREVPGRTPKDVKWFEFGVPPSGPVSEAPEASLGLMCRRHAEINDYNHDLLSVLRSRTDIRIVRLDVDTLGLNPLNPTSVLHWEFIPS